MNFKKKLFIESISGLGLSRNILESIVSLHNACFESYDDDEIDYNESSTGLLDDYDTISDTSSFFDYIYNPSNASDEINEQEESESDKYIKAHDLASTILQSFIEYCLTKDNPDSVKLIDFIDEVVKTIESNELIENKEDIKSMIYNIILDNGTSSFNDKTIGYFITTNQKENDNTLKRLCMSILDNYNKYYNQLTSEQIDDDYGKLLTPAEIAKERRDILDFHNKKDVNKETVDFDREYKPTEIKNTDSKISTFITFAKFADDMSIILRNIVGTMGKTKSEKQFSNLFDMKDSKKSIQHHDRIKLLKEKSLNKLKAKKELEKKTQEKVNIGASKNSEVYDMDNW